MNKIIENEVRTFVFWISGSSIDLNLVLRIILIPFRYPVLVIPCRDTFIWFIDIGSNDPGTNDIGSNDLGSNDIGSNDLGSNDIGSNGQKGDKRWKDKGSKWKKIFYGLFQGLVRLIKFMGRALRLGQARGPSAAANSTNEHKAQLKNMYFFRVRLRQFLGWGRRPLVLLNIKIVWN